MNSKNSNISFATSPGGSSRLAVWESSKGRGLDGDDDGDYLFERVSDKRQELSDGKIPPIPEGASAGITATKVQGRPGHVWGKRSHDDIELGHLKGLEGKVLVTTDVSVTEVRDDRSGSSISA